MSTKRWLGVAMDVQGVSTWTFADTFAAGDTVDVAINKKHLILTLGTDVALSDVAAETAAMINAISATAGRTGANADETRNFGGQQIPEFQEIVASSSGAVLTIKTTAGVPVTIAITVTTAGDGTVGSETVVTAATGKNFFDNADNWEGGVAPSAGDTILLDRAAPDIKYALNNTTERLNITRTNASTTSIGLPSLNPLGYVEYRQRWLDLPNTVTTGAQTFTIGDRGSTNKASGWFMFIDLGTTDGLSQNIRVYDAPASTAQLEYPVQFIRGVDIGVKVESGGVAIGYDNAQSDTSQIASLDVQGDCNLLLGAKAILLSAAPADVYSNARVRMECALTGANELQVHGGTVSLALLNTLVAFYQRGGTVTLDDATITTAYFYGGTFQEGMYGGTVTNANAYKGSTIKYRTDKIIWTNGIDCHGCQIGDVLAESPDHKTWTPSTI